MTIIQQWCGARPTTGHWRPRQSAWRLLLVLASGSLGAQTTYTPYVFTTAAGRASIGSEDGPGTAARFWRPIDVAADRAGNLYVVDSGNNAIRKVAPNGTVTTLAGLAGETGAADGMGSAARFNSPTGIAVDAFGTVYVADTGNGTIRKITPDGLVTTLAGAAGTFGSTDGIGTAATFMGPLGVAVNSAGDVFVVDRWDSHLRRVTADGVVSTFVDLSAGSDDSPINYAGGVAVDAAGNVYVSAPVFHRICRITPAGTVTTLRLADGTAALFDQVVTLAVDGAGNVYAPDATNRKVMRLTAAGGLSVLAALPPALPPPPGTPGYGAGVAVDALGNVAIADEANATILRVTAGGAVSTLAGAGPGFGSADGSGATARFFSPQGLAVDAGGTLYIADSENDTIRKMTPAGAVTTLAGLALNAGASDGTGSAARFNNPTAVAVDGGGNVYVADTGNYTVRKITPAGVVTTLAGQAGAAGQADGVGSKAQFTRPSGLVVDATGNVYVADLVPSNPIPKAFYYWVIRKITPAGEVKGGYGGADRTYGGANLAIDRAGNLYAAREIYTMVYYASFVAKIAADGTSTILAGTDSAPNGTSIDGLGVNARFIGITGLAMDNDGNFYVTDGHAVRRITAGGAVTTLAGRATVVGSADGLGSASRFDDPTGIAMDSAGRLYVADTDNNTIRVGVVASAPVIVNQPQSQTVASGGNVQFSVTVAGAPDPTLQWYRNGAALSGATGSTLSLPGALASDAGDYTVTATNALGSATSVKATLTVTTPGAGSAGGGGGGGALGGWLIAGLGLLGFGRACGRRRRRPVT